jgi:hypothetical protein
MQVTQQPSTLLFPIDRVANTIDLETQVLRNWVALGMIRPAMRGRKVRGRPHRFSVQQFIGLAYIVTMHRAGHMSRRIIKETLQGYEKMSFETLYNWLHRPEDMHVEERVIAASTSNLSGESVHHLLERLYDKKLADECTLRIVNAWMVIEQRLAELKTLSSTARLSGNRYQ